MDAFYWVLVSVFAIWFLWVFYLAVMAIKRQNDIQRLPVEVLVPGLATFYVALVIDLLVNVLIASVIFLEPPREATVSARLTRYIDNGSGWRHRFACWVCHRYLDPFDPDGSHCD